MTGVKLSIVIFTIGVAALTVRGQLVSCRASANCTGAPGDDLGREVDGRSCCLDNPRALAFVDDGGSCVPCVVIGFINNSFSGVEQGPGHSVPVGYRKGSGQNLVFNVGNVPGSGPDGAREGPQYDYTVKTVRVSALANGQIDNVVVTFRVDTIAQENNETFNLTLTGLNLPVSPGPGFFVVDTLPVEIVDSDTVQFSFTEDDYRASEPGRQGTPTVPPVIVSKSTRIANRIELVVVPLTIQNANATNLPLPPNIPDDDRRSPPFANLNDFNNTNITLVFEPDEDGEVREKDVPIFITDDAINEATEQVFVAELLLINSSNPASVDLTTRPSTLCRIIDNDPIRIGFELPGYTYTEPQFDTLVDQFTPIPPGRPESGPIYLLKENNVISEQTFLVAIQVTDSASSGTNIQSATFRVDYEFSSGGRTSETLFFLPSQQRILVTFELLADTLPEGTEAFQASASPEDTLETRAPNGTVISVERFPTPLSPADLASEVFINILDDDPIVIGFTNTSYTVDEGIGILQVDVQIFNLLEDQFIQGTTLLVIQTVSGSATGGSDYQEINAIDLNYLTFDNENRRRSFDVTIIDDSLFELDHLVEDFTLELRFDPFAFSPPSNVILHPNTTTVDIVDNEVASEVVIGFLNTSYTVDENDGLVNIQIGIINFTVLSTSLVVNFSISQNQPDRESLRFDNLLLNSTTPVVDLTVAITDYLFEFSESVVANIAFPGEPIPGVILEPADASINIDVLIIGFTDTKSFVNEGDRNVTLTIHIRGGANHCNKTEWMLYLVTQNVSAQPSEDYTNLEETIYVNASQPTSVMIPIVDNDILESDETFQVEISLQNSEDRNCVIVQPNVFNITILDNDCVEIGFVPNNGNVTEGVDRFLNLTAEVNSGELGLNVSVGIDIFPGGTAKNESDFVLSSGQFLTFGPATKSGLISILIVDDDLFEAKSENFFIGLNATELCGLHLARQTANLTIKDDDSVTIGFNSTTYTVRESDGSVPLHISLIDGEFDEDATVYVRLNTINGSADTSDFINETTPIPFSGNMTTRTVTLDIIDDNLLETNETFMAVLELVDDTRVILQPNATDVSIILDNDTVVIGFKYENHTVSEGVDMFGNITVDLLDGELGQEVVVTVSTQAGTAKDGEDFDTVTNHQLTFSPSVNSHPVPINISSDGNYEDIETFSLLLSVRDFGLQFNTGADINLRQRICKDEGIFSISNSDTRSNETINIDLDRIFVSQTDNRNGFTFKLAANESERVSVSPAKATVTILDNDTVTIGFNATLYSVNECEGQVSIKIIADLRGSLQREMDVYLSTSDLTANASMNYRGLPANHSLIFDSTRREHTVNISIIDTNETQPEVDEMFIVSLSFPESGESIPRVTLEPDNATVAIFEIEGRIGFMFESGSPSPIMVDETATGVVNLTVGLITGNLCGEVKIDFQVSLLNATEEDFTVMTESPLILSTELLNATITIDIINDDIIEPQDESFTITLLFPQGQPFPRVTLDPNVTTITILASDFTQLVETAPPLPTDPSALIGGILGAISFLLIAGIVLLIIFLFWFKRRTVLKKPDDGRMDDSADQTLKGFAVQSSYRLNLPPHLIVHASNIKMTETIGQGEFGVVYKGHLLEDGGKIVTATVAIKTLKGFYDSATVRDMLKECSKMSKFDHPNVLTLNGVCLDGGPAPFIIMPFMINGSLLAYLRKNRAILVISGDTDSQDDNEVKVCKQLMDMCLQVARGMEYLAKMKVVHRDLAARNCMIDMSYVIKVADFGLAESVGTKEYFRQDKSSAVKLPLKWLAPESLEDYIFSEKSDVWAYGVTCWEVFTAGKVPYATVHVNDLPNMLHNGYRLEKPVNDACNSEMFALVQRCWELEPKDRPTFSDLVSSLSQSLEAMASYMDVGAFGQLQVEPMESKPGDSTEKPQDHNSSEKESKSDEPKEVKVLLCVSETRM